MGARLGERVQNEASTAVMRDQSAQVRKCWGARREQVKQVRENMMHVSMHVSVKKQANFATAVMPHLAAQSRFRVWPKTVSETIRETLS